MAPIIARLMPLAHTLNLHIPDCSMIGYLDLRPRLTDVLFGSQAFDTLHGLSVALAGS